MADRGRVNRAIRETGTRDFFVLAKSSHLRTETKQFVPKVLSVTKIATIPAAYGFEIEHKSALGG